MLYAECALLAAHTYYFILARFYPVRVYVTATINNETCHHTATTSIVCMLSARMSIISIRQGAARRAQRAGKPHYTPPYKYGVCCEFNRIVKCAAATLRPRPCARACMLP